MQMIADDSGVNIYEIDNVELKSSRSSYNWVVNLAI
jgi:hypothetical protein